MFKEYCRFVKDLEPEWFVFENVVGFKSFDKGRFAIEVENSDVLNAADYGVPQERKRFFIIGNRNKKDIPGIKFDFSTLKRKKKISVGEALSDLPPLKNGDQLKEATYRHEAKQSIHIQK